MKKPPSASVSSLEAKTPHKSPHEESVEVYSNCDQVELFLNGKSFGAPSRPAKAVPRVWQAAFSPGLLRAVGKNEGREAIGSVLQTAGKPARLVLTTDRSRLAPDWEEVAFVALQITDANGVIVPSAQDKSTFRVTGPGVLAAVDNGDLTSHEPFQANERHVFQGECLAILRAVGPTGQITLTASADGLPPVTVSLEATHGATGQQP